jgi:hypothetical protein
MAGSSNTEPGYAGIYAERSNLLLDRHMSEQIRDAFLGWQTRILKPVWSLLSAIRLLRTECKSGAKDKTEGDFSHRGAA